MLYSVHHRGTYRPAQLKVEDGVIVSSTPALRYAIGQTLDYFIEHLGKTTTVKPLPASATPSRQLGTKYTSAEYPG